MYLIDEYSLLNVWSVFVFPLFLEVDAEMLQILWRYQRNIAIHDHQWLSQDFIMRTTFRSAMCAEIEISLLIFIGCGQSINCIRASFL